MKIATWNINSIRAREDRLLAWLERERPDVLCLQEIKVKNEEFPHDPLREAGYHAAVHGQKTYNGVAILSRSEPTSVVTGMSDDGPDEAARLIGATIAGVRVLSAYFPNGKSVSSPEYEGKLAWMGRLRRFLEATESPEKPLVLAGDFNVAPDDRDSVDPVRWARSVLCHRDVRDALARLIDWGLVDVFRQHHEEGGFFSWWDYRMLAFPKNDGLRIDHIFATAPYAERSQSARIDRNERKKGQFGKPSDHAPVIAEFA